ncbi:uncharacterized protein LOC106138074 isoform X2 [Amyelois transitella]|uniref:uncharacterized protein LOC106138074 isoform X2 n=1 Tax=Amyelois transitella TaxID=680683 RepID=UPI002990011E|nr:uncharacterized protein LOC106138074 isoform X2 [Amyelois transitella]
MKIPETSANVGAYYGNEENGQWQPNGVIMDSGVGGGVVGAGDAGVQRPPLYPVHVPRSHIPGYVMAGAYYPPAPYAAPATPDDFADYMWMENEEEFDKQVMQQLEEEALMEQCIEAMLEDEQRERRRPNGHHQYPTTSNGASSLSLEETVSRSRLNPLAAEFIPTAAVTRTVTEEKRDTPETPSTESQQSEQEEQKPEEAEQLTDTHTDPQIEPTPPPTDPPEVSAADVQTDDKRKDKHNKRSEPKRAVRDNKAKGKAAQVKEATKVGKKEERREGRVGNSGDDSDGDVQPQPAPVEEQTGPKPINYAAAAKANKPKKPSTPPAAEKTSPVPTAGTKIDKKKVDKPVQRKNSAK